VLAWTVAFGVAYAAEPVSPEGRIPQMDCKAVGTMPGSPFTQAQCERQLELASQLQQAMNTPGGERAGDSQMTCEQIIGELKQVAVPGVAQEHAAESVAAGRNLQSTYDAAMAEAKAASLSGAGTGVVAAASSIIPGAVGIGSAAVMA